MATAIETIQNQIAARGSKNLVALGINCINPDFVSDLFKTIKVNVPLVVYPNSGEKFSKLLLKFACIFNLFFLGETYSVETGWQGKNSCKPIDDYVEEWIGLGAKFIGGCCRSNADDIKKIKEKVQSLKQ